MRFSKHTVASVEQGRRMPDPSLVERAEEALGNTGALREAARHLCRQPGLAAWFRQWARLERVAISLYTYECRVVPGLLQTEAYAQAVSLTVELAERIAARLARQELLSTSRKPPAAFSFIIEQAVLERYTGGEEVTRELLDHLLNVDERHWNVELQIMPLRKPVHAGLDGPLQLLETPKHRWFGYSEGQENGRLISDPKEISVLQHRYAKLRSQAAGADARRPMSTPELIWHKSSYSSGSQGDCVEVAACPGTVHVRDSKDEAGAQLAFSSTEWADFVAYAAGR